MPYNERRIYFLKPPFMKSCEAPPLVLPPCDDLILNSDLISASISPVAEASGSVAALAAKSAFEDVNSMAIDVLPWEKGDLSIKPSEGIKPSEVEMKKALLPVKTISKEKKLSGKEALTKLLRWHFGHPEYRGKQLEAIEAVLSGFAFISFFLLQS
ncbi:hypothetical protein L1887_29237 [Cichorium endivia]|nr:hypothetical protein L1887_29237 [Cichorium endivia]